MTFTLTLSSIICCSNIMNVALLFKPDKSLFYKAKYNMVWCTHRSTPTQTEINDLLIPQNSRQVACLIICSSWLINHDLQLTVLHEKRSWNQRWFSMFAWKTNEMIIWLSKHSWDWWACSQFYKPVSKEQSAAHMSTETGSACCNCFLLFIFTIRRIIPDQGYWTNLQPFYHKTIWI